MSVEEQVVRAAQDRADALAAGDRARLEELLHPSFRWVNHQGGTMSRQEYVDRNAGGGLVWRSQRLHDPTVTVVGTTAVLHTVVSDVVATTSGDEEFRMPVTQVWVLGDDSRWTCLAGHAGPRLSA
ncbi:DUF4440 domain-containing protein [Nocardioides sp. YIM 123512]|uniref:DUF4440 domain-containing protein n=1 Tax=Nocardioides flavescens TaxID=2691959 RepID=A0A6L7EZY2_9ACTN|nr:DUF4440 domain-containing protein [Nocardioides flavescens]